MKKINLFLLVLVFAMNVSAFERTKPVPNPSYLQVGEEMYLYNVGKDMFFTQGNTWGAQGSVGESGFKVKFCSWIPEGGEWDGKTYLFQDYVEPNEAWYEVFIDASVYHIYVDRHNDQPDYLWELESVGNKTYRFFPADANPTVNRGNEDGINYSGVDVSIDPSSTVVHPFLQIDMEGIQEGDYLVDWQFVTTDDYALYQEQLALYRAAQNLETVIVEAEAAQIDVVAERAVYENQNSSIQDFDAAVKSVKKKYNAMLESAFAPLKPLDMDEKYVVNTTFDENIDGWQTTTNNGANYPNADENVDGYHFVNKFWLNWNGSPLTGRMYKLLTDMPKGVYHLRLAAYSEAGKEAYVYAFQDCVELNTSAPNFYDVYTFVYDTDEFEIGLNCPVANSCWIGIDNVHLEYLGNTKESIKFIVDYYLENSVSHDDDYCYISYMDEYKEAVKSLSEVTDYETAAKAVGRYKKACNEVEECVAAYNVYALLLERAYRVLESKSAPELDDYVLMANDVLNEMRFTTAEIRKESELFAEMIEVAEKTVYDEDKYTPTNPLNMDETFVVNTTFDENTVGWLSTSNCDVSQCDSDPERVDGEIFSGKFWLNYKSSVMTGKMYKNVVKVPEGVYHLRLAAYSEAGKDAYVYAFQDSVELSMSDPCYYDVYTFVYGTDEFEIGLSCPVANSHWMGIDNVHLEYYGRNKESFSFIAQYYYDNAPSFAEEDCSAELLQKYNEAVEALLTITDYKSAVEIISAYKDITSEIKTFKQLQWEGCQASLICIDPGWSNAVWSGKGKASNADITDYGTYTITETVDGGLNGVDVFCVDIFDAAELYKAENTMVTIDKLTVDDVEVVVDNSKLLWGDLENNGNFRIEIYNIYGAGTSNDSPIDRNAMVGEKVSVTFTLTRSDVDGIEEINQTSESGAAYNLAGQRVDDSYRGIVIQNGKKWLRK